MESQSVFQTETQAKICSIESPPRGGAGGRASTDGFSESDLAGGTDVTGGGGRFLILLGVASSGAYHVQFVIILTI